MRFASRYAASFRNESFVRLSSQHQTKPRCEEDYIDRDGLPLRAVVCMRAYKKLPQLYDVAVLVATLDQSQTGVEGRFDAQLFADCAVDLFAEAKLPLGRMAASLDLLATAGGLRLIWPAAIALAEATTAKRPLPTGTSEVLALLHRYIAEVPASPLPDGVLSLAEEKGSTKSHHEARTLIADLAGVLA